MSCVSGGFNAVNMGNIVFDIYVKLTAGVTSCQSVLENKRHCCLLTSDASKHVHGVDFVSEVRIHGVVDDGVDHKVNAKQGLTDGVQGLELVGPVVRLHVEYVDRLENDVGNGQHHEYATHTHKQNCQLLLVVQLCQPEIETNHQCSQNFIQFIFT